MRRSDAGSAAALRTAGAVGATRTRARDVLIVLQVALCTVLLLLGAAFVQGTRRALATDLGFDATGVAFIGMDVGTARLNAEQAARFFVDARTAVLNVPGVSSATVVSSRPLSGDEDVESLDVPGYALGPNESRAVRVIAASAGAVPTLGLRLAAGRGLDESDDLGPAASVMVNTAFASRYFRSRDVVGREVSISGVPLRIAGVVLDARYDAPDREATPVVWVPLPQRAGAFMVTSPTLAVRTSGNGRSMLPAITAAIRGVRPDVPLFGPGSFEDTFNSVLAPQRLGATLFSLFGGLALLTAAIGLYGMLAYVLSHRMREFGVRTALGARPRDLTGLMVRFGLGRVMVGLVAGVFLAQLAGGAARPFLWGASLHDLPSLLVTVGVMVTAGLAASLGPARRAARADPMETLRME
jgi:predicted permease